MYRLIPIYEQCMKRSSLKEGWLGTRERGRGEYGYKWMGGEMGGLREIKGVDGH